MSKSDVIKVLPQFLYTELFLDSRSLLFFYILKRSGVGIYYCFYRINPLYDISIGHVKVDRLHNIVIIIIL